MVTLAQRIEALRTEANLSRPALAAALGLPKGAFDKFETGRATPTKEQQEKMAAYFGVSLFYLRGESNDRTRQETWMDAVSSDEDERPAQVKKPRPAEAAKAPGEEQSTMWDALLAGRQTQDLIRRIVLETLKSPEGQALIARAVARELGGRGGPGT